MVSYQKPCCWICGKEVPRYDLDKRKGTCGDFRCLEYRRRENLFLMAVIFGLLFLFAGLPMTVWFLYDV